MHFQSLIIHSACIWHIAAALSAMRGFRIGAVRHLLGSAIGKRQLHTENDIYRPTSGGVPSILGEVITAMLEGMSLL